jgi:hypothetical protein
VPIEKSCLRRSLDYGRADRNYSDEPPQILGYIALNGRQYPLFCLLRLEQKG